MLFGKGHYLKIIMTNNFVEVEIRPAIVLTPYEDNM